MSTEIKKEIQLEIAHVLFIDIVGYSKLLMNEQRTLLDTLNQVVRPYLVGSITVRNGNR
jgi:hypothetical protein